MRPLVIGRVLAAGVFVLLLAGCSSDEAAPEGTAEGADSPEVVSTEIDDEGNYVTFDEATAEPSVEAVPEPTPDDREVNVEDILDAVNFFVDTRDLIVVDEAPLADLENFVSETVMAQVVVEQEQNLAWVEEYDTNARYAFVTYPWFIDAEYRGDTLVAVICSERQSQRFNGNVEIVLVDQAFVFDVSSDFWQLIEVQTRHDGSYDMAGLTCVSPAMAGRARTATERALEQIDLIFAEPEIGRDYDYSQLFGGPMQLSLEIQLGELPLDRYRVTPTEYRYRILGLDASRPPFYVQVSVCKHYPEGVVDELYTTGEQVPFNEQLVAGVSVEDVYTVFLEPVPRSEDRKDVVFDFEPGVSLGCW